MTSVPLPEFGIDVPDEGLSIGQAAQATGVGVEALRYYDREGLLLDPTPRDSGGRRRYGTRDLRWIAGLVILRETGMTIADIRVVADLSRREGTEPERLELFLRHREHVLEQLARTRRHLAAIDLKITAYRQAVSGTANGDHRS